jgi:hypothetical protein
VHLVLHLVAVDLAIQNCTVSLICHTPSAADLRPDFFCSIAGIHAINADKGVNSSFPAINGHQSSISLEAALFSIHDIALLSVEVMD